VQTGVRGKVECQRQERVDIRQHGAPFDRRLVLGGATAKLRAGTRVRGCECKTFWGRRKATARSSKRNMGALGQALGC
jgi:hypothetical protein